MKTKEEIELAAMDEFKLKLPFTGDPIVEMAFLESIRQAFIVGALWMQSQSVEHKWTDEDMKKAIYKGVHWAGYAKHHKEGEQAFIDAKIEYYLKSLAENKQP